MAKTKATSTPADSTIPAGRAATMIHRVAMRLVDRGAYGVTSAELVEDEICPCKRIAAANLRTLRDRGLATRNGISGHGSRYFDSRANMLRHTALSDASKSPAATIDDTPKIIVRPRKFSPDFLAAGPVIAITADARPPVPRPGSEDFRRCPSVVSGVEVPYRA